MMFHVTQTAAPCSTQGTNFIWIDPQTDQRWERFLADNARAGIFLHPGWLGFIGKQSKKIVQALCLLKDDSIHSAIPILLDEGVSNRQAVSIPFYNNSGSILSATGDIELEQSLINSLQTMHIARCIFRDNLGATTFPRLQQGYIHCLDISGTAEEILNKQITKHCQRNIRKAERNRLEISIRTDYDALHAFHQLHVLTRKRQGLPAIPYSFFIQFHENLIEQHLGCIVQVASGKRILSSGIFAGLNNTFSFKYGASDSAFSEYRANHAMLWHAIKHAKLGGYTIFDLGRCELRNGGLRRFKLSWGAVEHPLFFSYYPSPPTGSLLYQASKMILKPFIKVGPKYLTETIGKMAYSMFPAMLS